MNVTFNQGEVVNGWTITERNGLTRYVARNDRYIICFDTEAGEGRNYFQIQWLTDKITTRHYRAWRYFYKFIPTIQGISSELYFRYKKENA